MGMGEQHRVQPRRPRRQELPAEVRPGVDQQPAAARPLHQRRGAGPAVARLRRVAGAPVAALVRRRRAAARRPSRRSRGGSRAARPGGLSAALGNRRWKLAVVSASTSADADAAHLRQHLRGMRPHRPARSACRAAARARGTGCRSPPAAGPPAGRRRCARIASPLREGQDAGEGHVAAQPHRRLGERRGRRRSSAAGRGTARRPRAPPPGSAWMSSSASRAWITSGRPEIARGPDMPAEALLLHLARRLVVEVVQAALADADDPRMVGQRQQLRHARQRRLADAAADGRPPCPRPLREALGQRPDRRRLVGADADRDHALHPGLARARDHRPGSRRRRSSRGGSGCR